MNIGYLIKVLPGLEEIVPADVESYVQIYADENGVYTAADLGKITKVDAFIISMEPVNEQILAATERLKIVQRLGVGYETIDLEAVARRQIPACNIDGVNKEAVAEHNMALILSLAKKLPEAINFTQKSDWPSARELTRKAFELKGCTIGIIGFGDTGSSLAKRAHGFEMKIVYNEVRDVNGDIAEQVSATRVSKEQLLSTADIVCVCTDLNDSTRYMIDADAIALMRPETTFLCCARGGIVDEPALAQALKKGKIAQAGIDVFETEPVEPDNPLLGLPNCIVTSHVAGATYPTTMRTWEWAHENIRAVVNRGERPRWIKNGV